LKNQLSEIVIKLLSRNKISFDRNELLFQIQSHPSYPSLHSITGVLDHFNIDNVAAEIPVNLETLKQLPNFFIAQVVGKKGKDLVTIKKNNDSYIIINGANKKEILNTKQFIDKFTGIIVAVEKQEKDNTPISSKIIFRNFLSISLLVVVSILLINSKAPILNIYYLLLSFIGILISVAIIKQDLGQETVIGNAFCTGSTEKKDCDAVLTSKGAELIKGYKLSDFSLLYFVVLFFTTFVQLKAPKIPLLISFIALPIIVYSIYYQYFILKKWCLLCLTIVAVLILQALLSYFIGISFYEIHLNESLEVLLFGLIALLSWSLLKPLISDISTLREEKIKSAKFQRNFEVFETMLRKSKKVNTRIENTQELVFGNSNAKLEIVIITNPFCGHCRPVHENIEKILKKYKNEVKVVIRFSINTDNIKSDGVAITTRLLEIYDKQNKEEALDAMHDIYSGMKSAIWLKEWGNCNEKEKQLQVLKEERNWCIKNKINFTPEILINGYSYPKQYLKSDLNYFIEDLIEN